MNELNRNLLIENFIHSFKKTETFFNDLKGYKHYHSINVRVYVQLYISFDFEGILFSETGGHKDQINIGICLIFYHGGDSNNL